MISKDIRINNNVLRDWKGKTFEKYRCDAFSFNSSVTQIASLFIDGKVYAITNIQETVDYFGNQEEIALFKVNEIKEEDAKSAFKDVEQIETPINEAIDSIRIINENQKISNSEEMLYDVWFTRAIIISVGGREILFEKDIVPFSEEIIIKRGYNLADNMDSEKDFLGGWDIDITPECSREVVEL